VTAVRFSICSKVQM